MSLESLVPPLPLCQQLKPGDFPESALVWMHRTALDGICDDPFCVTNRLHAEHYKREMYPAPTLAEILSELPSGSIVGKDRNKFLAQGTLDIIDMVETDEHPATAALRLWLRLNGREVKG